MPTLVIHVGGPHTGAHCDVKKLRWVLTPSVDQEILDNVCELFTRGDPNKAKGFSSNDNIKAY